MKVPEIMDILFFSFSLNDLIDRLRSTLILSSKFWFKIFTGTWWYVTAVCRFWDILLIVSRSLRMSDWHPTRSTLTSKPYSSLTSLIHWKNAVFAVKWRQVFYLSGQYVSEAMDTKYFPINIHQFTDILFAQILRLEIGTTSAVYIWTFWFLPIVPNKWLIFKNKGNTNHVNDRIVCFWPTDIQT